MNNNEYQKLWMCANRIRYFQHMIATCNDPFQITMYENFMNMERNRYYQLYYQYIPINNMSNDEGYEISKSDLREFTIEELSQYDGSNGRPAYVAVNGIVYDVSLEATWGGGTHFGMYAGQDLTAQFKGCHGVGIQTLNNLPQIGLLTNS